MISLSELEKLLEKDLGNTEPEIRQLARMITEVLNQLNENLLEQDFPEQERRPIHEMVVTALECQMRGLPPLTEEVKFCMQMLDPKVFLPVESGVH